MVHCSAMQLWYITKWCSCRAMLFWHVVVPCTSLWGVACAELCTYDTWWRHAIMVHHSALLGQSHASLVHNDAIQLWYIIVSCLRSACNYGTLWCNAIMVNQKVTLGQSHAVLARCSAVLFIRMRCSCRALQLWYLMAPCNYGTS